jgi:hypothetical protein
MAMNEGWLQRKHYEGCKHHRWCNAEIARLKAHITELRDAISPESYSVEDSIARVRRIRARLAEVEAFVEVSNG